MNQNLLSVNELTEKLNAPVSWIYSRTRETGPNTMPRIVVDKYRRFELKKVLDWLKKKNEGDQNFQKGGFKNAYGHNSV